MAVVSDSEVALAKRAAADGVLFEPMTFDWASEPGPIGIAELADETGDMDVMRRAEIGVPAIEQIFKRLDGLQPVLESGRVEKGFMAVLVARADRHDRRGRRPPALHLAPAADAQAATRAR